MIFFQTSLVTDAHLTNTTKNGKDLFFI